MTGVPARNRLVWLDWMKAFAIYLIIAGHCLVPGYIYVYVFSVPVFFIMSGFLTKRESDTKLFWTKLFGNLIVPMVLFIAVQMLYAVIYRISLGTFEVDYLWKRPLKAILGMQTEGLGVMWFVYTLVICKIILQLIPVHIEKAYLFIGGLFSLIICYFYNNSGIRIANAVVNVFLAFPFFTMGYLLRPYKEMISTVKKGWLPIYLLIGIVCICFCGSHNEIVYLYCCSYGQNMLLCFIGAFGGTIFLYAIARMLELYLADLIYVIGGGTIIILGLHGIMMSIFRMTVCNLISFDGIWIYAESFFILIAIIPIIIFIKKYIPVLYGNKRV